SSRTSRCGSPSVCSGIPRTPPTIGCSPRSWQDFAKRQIAPYKYPRAVEFITSLPRTSTGKVQRYVLRQRSSTVEPA
ncbi:hypothetical protein AB0H87_38860, partial [Asanoa sp. NPDC050611]